MSDATGHSSSTPPPPAKKPYRSPRLVAYGNIAKLTQGGGSRPKSDGGSGMARTTPA